MFAKCDMVNDNTKASTHTHFICGQRPAVSFTLHVIRKTMKKTENEMLKQIQ